MFLIYWQKKLTLIRVTACETKTGNPANNYNKAYSLFSLLSLSIREMFQSKIENMI